MTTKIQINSLQALLRLIGDDTTMEVEVRNSVIQAFAQGFAKSLANTTAIADVLKGIEQKLRDDVRQTAQMTFSDYVTHRGYQTWEIPSKAKDAIRSRVIFEVEAYITECIQTATKDLEKRIEALVEDRLERKVQSVVAKIVAANVEEMLKK